MFHQDFPGGSDGKASVYNAGDLGLIPGSGKFSGEGNGNPRQYACLENPMDRGAWCRQRVGHDWVTSQHVLDIFRFWRQHFFICTVFLVSNFQIGLPWMRHPVSKDFRVCLNCQRTSTPISTPRDSFTVQALATFSLVSWSSCAINDSH